MDQKERAIWNARPVEVKVFTHCDHCKTLKESVESRSHKCYWPYFEVSMTSCQSCFDSAKRAAEAEASGLIVC